MKHRSDETMKQCDLVLNDSQIIFKLALNASSNKFQGRIKHFTASSRIVFASLALHL
jgi:hypothetical protein